MRCGTRSNVGDYSIAIRFNEAHIPGSPFAMLAAASTDSADRVTVRSSRVTFDSSSVLGRPLSSFVETQTSAARSSLQLGVRCVSV